MVPGLRDDSDLALQLLRQIAENTGSSGGSPDVTVDGDPTRTETPRYFTTGPKPLAVTETDEFVEVEFGITARTVNIRTTDAVIISFQQPTGNSTQGEIRIKADESPFTIGGYAGIDAPRLWIKKDADTATSDPNVQIIAFN